MSDNDQKKLDVGCGCHKIKGAIGIDIDSNSNAEIIHDLNIFPYPMDDNSFDEIYAKHIIEHLDDPQGFVKELHRVLKPGGTLFIETPHFSNYVCYSEPQHKRFFSYFMLRNIVSPLNFKVLRNEITFYKTFKMFGIKAMANKHPEGYERFWTYIFPAENLKVLLQKE